jgi:hypothetical protein
MTELVDVVFNTNVYHRRITQMMNRAIMILVEIKTRIACDNRCFVKYMRANWHDLTMRFGYKKNACALTTLKRVQTT